MNVQNFSTSETPHFSPNTTCKHAELLETQLHHYPTVLMMRVVIHSGTTSHVHIKLIVLYKRDHSRHAFTLLIPNLVKFLS